MRWSLLALSLATIGCSEAGRPCGGKFLILWPDARGAYAPTVVETPTLRDSKILDGPAARVYFEGAIGERGFQGQPARPNVTNADGVCVPMDTGSSAAVSAYAQFERLRDFDIKLGVADQVSWPRAVGVEIKMTGASIDTHNNAHYTPDRDITTLVPSTLPGVPAGMNLGIVAHEHFHAHFQTQVMRHLRLEAANTTISELFPIDFGMVDHRVNVLNVINATVLRAWNEGLADLYAAVYTGDPRFFKPTYGGARPDLVMNRSLDADLYPLGSSILKAQAARVRFRAYRTDAERDLTASAYQQGTALARLLFQVVRGQTRATPEVALSKIMTGLADLPTRLKLDDAKVELDFGSILPNLLDGIAVGAGVCDVIRQKTSPEVFGRISACVSSSP